MTDEKLKPATNTFKVKGNWSIQSGKLKSKFPILTDDDLKYESGKESELLAKVGKRLNKSPEETTVILEKNMH